MQGGLASPSLVMPFQAGLFAHAHSFKPFLGPYHKITTSYCHRYDKY